MKRRGPRASLLFRLIVPASLVFILTILAIIAAVFGDERAPMNQWLDQFAGRLLAIEFTVIIVLVILAMACDRFDPMSSDYTNNRPPKSGSDRATGTKSITDY